MPTVRRRRGAAYLAALLVLSAGIVVPLASAAPASAAPDAPVITSPAPDASEPSPTVVVSGTASDEASVVVSDGGLAVGSTTASASGLWSVPVSLLAGSHDLTAVQSVTGVESPASPAVKVTVLGNDLVVNGGFESPPVGGASGGYLNAASIPGWSPTKVDCGIELQDFATLGVLANDGSQYAELASNCVSGVTQTLPTVPGTQYVVSYAYRARPGTDPTTEDTMGVDWGGTQIDTVTGDSSWVVASEAVTASSTETSLAFDDLNANTGDSLGDFLDSVSVVPAVSLEPPNTSWLTAQSLSPTASQAIAYPGEALWYKFPINPDEQVSVSLTNVPADDSIALFSDISQTFAAENASTPNLAALGAEAPGNAASPSAFSPSAFSPSAFSPSAFSPSAFSPSAFSPSAFSPSAFSPSAFSPSAFSPSAFSAAYSAAQLDSLLAVSTAPGAVDKSVTADTWNNTGDFYVRVTGNNGATSPTPYQLSVTTSGGPCAGVSLSDYSSDGFASTSGGSIAASSPSNVQTVIVDNSSLMPAAGAAYTGADALAPALQTLASRTNGVVVDVGASQRVADLEAQAKAHPGCPYAENLVASAIQDIINTYRTPTNTVKYVVIVGDDDVIPFFRYPDTAGLAPESDYSPPLVSTTAADAALASNYYLSDDQYGAASQLTIQGSTLPLVNSAVGRLVETPSDILATINRFVSDDGVLPTPDSSLVTGYDFMQPPASAIGQAFASGIPGGRNDTLLTADGTPASSSLSWSASQLASSLFGVHHSIVFLGAHFSANNLLAADDTTTLTTNQFASEVGAALQNSLVLSAGCHSGYPIDAADAIPGVTDPLAWPQAFTEAGATLIAGTGYQYGDTDYTAYSDQAYVDLAQQLGYGSGPVPIGDALLAAKQQYLAGLDQLNGMEEKALAQITLYGLPMLAIEEPHQTPAPGTTATRATASAVTTNPGVTLGLEQATLDVQPTLTPTAGPTPFTYDAGPQGVVADPGGPVLPLQTEDVNVAGETLRGVGFWQGTYSDTPAQVPLTGEPATDLSVPTLSRFSSPVFFPQTMWNPNYFRTLETGGDTELALTPVQYVSDPGSATTDTMRTYSDLNLHLFYSNDTSRHGLNTPALAGPPTITDVSSTTNGDVVSVSATVAGDPSAGIQEVWVSYTGAASGDPLYGSWRSVELTQSTSDSTHWTGTFVDGTPSVSGNPASDARFIVQAVNGVGVVGMDNNNGADFTPTLTPGAPPLSATATSIALGPTLSGVYGGVASLSATLTASATSATIAGAPITFALGGSTVTATTGPTGTATATMPIDETPGPYVLTASYGGDADNLASGTSAAFVVKPATTAVSLSSPPSIVEGTDSAISATLVTPGGSGSTPLAQKTVYFVLTNPDGTVIAARSAITNGAGVASAGAFTAPAGAVGPATVTAYFGQAGVPLPGGTTYDATDPDYAPSAQSASVSVLDPTQTSLAVIPGSPAFGAQATLVATVAPAVGTGPWVGTAPSGTVSFYDGTDVVGIATLTGASVDSATAVVRGLQPGPHNLRAVYAGSGDFLSSSGSVTTAVTVTETIAGTYRGSVHIGAGDLVLVTGQVDGDVSVSPGGALAVVGGSIRGAVRSSGAVAFSLCGATLHGALAVTASTGYVLIGGGAGTGCGPSLLSGSVLLDGNTGGLTVVGATVHGAVRVLDNSGAGPVEESGAFPPPTVSATTVDGPLECRGNTPEVVDAGQANTATVGVGQCAALVGPLTAADH